MGARGFDRGRPTELQVGDAISLVKKGSKTYLPKKQYQSQPNKAA